MISSFDKKPESGGMPAIASQATTIAERGVRAGTAGTGP